MTNTIDYLNSSDSNELLPSEPTRVSGKAQPVIYVRPHNAEKDWYLTFHCEEQKAITMGDVDRHVILTFRKFGWNVE